MPIPHEQIDPDAQKVIKRLVRNNHQAYLVGGCVRDLLLGRTPKDFDIATSATPPEIKSLFRNCRIIGRRFRLAHVFFGPKIIETSTFRANPREVEGEADGGDEPVGDILIRRDNVFGTAEEDARRRDFTINGLFYDIEADQVIDYVGGLHDLAVRTVRTIGDPEIRFREDPVRILRAIKFAARLDFHIDPAAYEAILTHKVEIPKCAPPRVLEEIYRLLRGGAGRRSLELLCETGVLELLVPELAALVGGGGDPAGTARLVAVLTLLDEKRVAAPTNALLLCALVGTFLGEALFDDGAGPRARGDERVDVADLYDERARPILEQLRVSRRDGERARQILLSLRRMAPSKRRRGRPMGLARRDSFDEMIDAFQLLGTVLLPPEVMEGELERWRVLQREGRKARPAGEGEGAPAADDAANGRRRRRRGGRHRQGGEGGGAAPGDGALTAERSTAGR